MASAPPRRAAAAPVSAQARAARTAVGALFFTNAVVYATVVPRLPAIKSELELSNAQVGSAIAAAPLGALLAGAFASALLVRWGSARVAVGSLMLMAANLLLISVAPTWTMLAGAFFVAGMCDSVADIADNAHGLRVQRLYGRSILNGFHGVWSVGAVAGGLVGSAAAGLSVPLPLHLGSAALLSIVVVLVTARRLLPGHDDTERAELPAGQLPHARSWGSGAVVRSLLVLGVVGGIAGAIEDSGATWSGIYLRDSLGAAPAVAGLGFVALQAMQALGRLTGDRWVTRYGDRTVARWGGALAALGMGVALAWPGIVTTIVGFGAVGLGIATLIPATMHAADALRGLPPGLALSVVGLVIRIGFFVQPPAIGVIADASSLRAALVLVPVAAGVVLVAAGALTTRTPALGRA